MESARIPPSLQDGFRFGQFTPARCAGLISGCPCRDERGRTGRSRKRDGLACHANRTVPPTDPPDCIGTTASGEHVAFEVTEFVDQETVKLNKAGKHAFKQWLPDELITKLQEKITAKDSKEFHGGPYSKVMLVIHTDEPLLSHVDCEKILRGKKFGPCKKIDDAYLIFSDVLGRE